VVECVVALDTPLNERQVEVLRWINDDCPEGRWTDFSFKTTAVALASRRLVVVSKGRGIWSAAILPAGEHYLVESSYPAGHWAKRRRGHRGDLDVPTRPHVVPERPVAQRAAALVATCATKQPPLDALTPTRKLLQDIIDAGGILEVDTREEKTNCRSLVGIINRRRMAPDGQEVILLDSAKYHHLILRLSSVSDWKTEPPTKTAADERIGRWHQAVAALRAEKRLDSIDKVLRNRGVRLLHALAREAETRGYIVRLSERNVHGYVEDSSKLRGDLIVRIGEIDCSIDVWQPKDRVPHLPTPAEIAREKLYSWDRPPRYDYVKADRLSIAIDTSSRFSSKVTWTDTKTLPLELRLPDVMTTFERWSVIDTERKESERRAEIEKRERREREDELARQAYVQRALGERLIADLDGWELSVRLRRYLAEMAEKTDCINGEEERVAAADWLTWCEQYAAQQDPFTRPIRRPKIKPPGYSDIQDFRNRLGFGSGFW
jgi:hypothetical protein